MRESVRDTVVDYGRGVGGALLVGLQFIFTFEGWWAGFSMPAYKVLLLTGFNMGVLLILQYYSGIQPDRSVVDRIREAIVAYGIGVFVAALGLYGFNVLGPESVLRTVVGSIAIAAIPLSIGASVAMHLFGDEEPAAEERKAKAGFFGFLGMGLGGAMVFGFPTAVTQEPMVVGIGTDAVHAIALIISSLLMVYLVVHAVGFRQRDEGPRASWWSVILRHGVSTYMMAFLTAAYLLWTFGYIHGGSGLSAALHMTVSLTLMTSIGAAAAHLLI